MGVVLRQTQFSSFSRTRLKGYSFLSSLKEGPCGLANRLWGQVVCVTSRLKYLIANVRPSSTLFPSAIEIARMILDYWNWAQWGHTKWSQGAKISLAPHWGNNLVFRTGDARVDFSWVVHSLPYPLNFYLPKKGPRETTLINQVPPSLEKCFYGCHM